MFLVIYLLKQGYVNVYIIRVISDMLHIKQLCNRYADIAFRENLHVSIEAQLILNTSKYTKSCVFSSNHKMKEKML